MRVLFIITKSNWGGAQRYVFDLATESKKRGHNTKVIAGGDGELFRRISDAGVEATTLPHLGRDVHIFDDVKVFWELYKILKKDQPDVLHLNSSKIGGIGALAGRLARVPRIIFTIHAFASNEDRGYVQKKAILFLSWITLLLSHKAIAVSVAVQKQALAFPFVRNKITLVHHGIREESLNQKEGARCIISPRALPKKIWIGTIGELHSVKGQEYLVRAMKHIEDPEVACLIVGTGEREAYLKELIKTEGLSEKVFLVGHVSRAGNLVQAFDIFVLPSLSEALGYVLLEAGFGALPVVATHVGGIPDIITDRKTGILVPPGDEKALADALLTLLKNLALQKQYGSALKEHISHEFSFETMVRNTFKTYAK